MVEKGISKGGMQLANALIAALKRTGEVEGEGDGLARLVIRPDEIVVMGSDVEPDEDPMDVAFDMAAWTCEECGKESMDVAWTFPFEANLCQPCVLYLVALEQSGNAVAM